jgi:PST family polysaccharide transporter
MPFAPAGCGVPRAADEGRTPRLRNPQREFANMLPVSDQLDNKEPQAEVTLALSSEVKPPRAVGTGTMVAAGTIWVMLQTLATKAVMMAGQLILAWLLNPKDFGEIGLAYTVIAFVTLITNPGIDVILVRRGRRFHLWSTPAFYFSLATGLLGCISILVASPLVAHNYQTPQLIGLLAVLALATPIGSLQIVPTSKLRSELNFKMLSIITVGQSVLQTVLTIAFAAMGAGAYSWVLPVPIAYAVATAVLWRVSRPEVHWRNPFRHWRYLIGDSGYLFGQRALVTVVSQGDYIILGSLYGAAIVGPYFFAYGIATQAIRLTAGSLQLVLMAGLARMPAYSNQQTQAAFRATKAIALVGVPLCLLQATIAGPLLRALYGDKWLASIPLVQLISVGLAFDVIGWPACSLLQSRGQFRFLLWWSLVTTIIFIGSVLTGAYFGQALGVALVICLFYIVLAPILGTWIFRSAKIGWMEIIELYARPLLIGLITVAVAIIAIKLSTELPPLLQLGVASITSSIAMIFAARALMPETWNDIVVKLVSAFPRFASTSK